MFHKSIHQPSNWSSDLLSLFCKRPGRFLPVDTALGQCFFDRRFAQGSDRGSEFCDFSASFSADFCLETLP